MKFNKKLIIMLCSFIAAFLLIVVILMLLTGNKSKIWSYETMEEKIILAGQNYFADHKDDLPQSGTISISIDKLVSEGYLNNLSEHTSEGVVCNGDIFVTKNPSDYTYRVKLDCGDNYSTNNFKEVVMNSLTTSGSGLYEEQQVNPNNVDEYQTVYVFKGDNVKNYIKVGDYYWRIIKVFENGEIMVIGQPELLKATWDNRFNIETNSYNGINEYSVSRIKDTIDSDVVNDEDGYLMIKSLITTHTACVGKRYLNDDSRDGSAECSVTLENQYFSLLPVYDYVNASLDNNCVLADDSSCYNYNYLASLDKAWWTITGVADNTNEVYNVNNTIVTKKASTTNAARLVAYLDSNVVYVSGAGTYDNPYIIK